MDSSKTLLNKNLCKRLLVDEKFSNKSTNLVNVMNIDLNISLSQSLRS